MAPSAARKLRISCYGQREVEGDNSRLGSAMELLPCSSFSSSADKEDDNNGGEILQQSAGCCTPKGKRFRIPEILACPPAPMKPRVAPKLLSRRSSSSAMPITFFAPPDIELFFFLAFQNVSA